MTEIVSASKDAIGLLEKYAVPAVGVGAGWMLGEFLDKKMDLPARIAFAIPKSVGEGQERQDMTDILMLGLGAGLLLFGLMSVYKGFVGGNMMEKAVNGAVGGICVRLAIEFINSVSSM